MNLIKLQEVCKISTTPSTSSESVDFIEPTRLYPLKRDVDQENSKRITSLAGESHYFDSIDFEKFSNSSHLATLQKSCPAPARLELKIGAQVILLKNLNFNKELGISFAFAEFFATNANIK